MAWSTGAEWGYSSGTTSHPLLASAVWLYLRRGSIRDAGRARGALRDWEFRMKGERGAGSSFRIAIPDRDIEGVNRFVQSMLANRELDPRVRRALELVQQDASAQGGSRTIHHILRVVNMSASRFRHLFKSETGVSPTRLLKVRRLCTARKLLQTTFLSVKQIAAALGVNDMSHFVNDYHAAFGETPTQTRREKQNLAAQQEAPSNSHFSQYI